MPVITRQYRSSRTRKVRPAGTRYKASMRYGPNSRKMVRWTGKIPRNPVHSFVRKCSLVQNLAVNAAGATGYLGYATYFTLANLNSYTDFSNLFDQYRINFIVMRIIWRSTELSQLETQNNSGVGAPYVIHYVDRDDATPPASSAAGANEAREYAKARQWTFDTGKRELVVKLVPNNLTQMYDSSVSTSYTLAFKKWIDMVDTQMPYYGWKAVFVLPQNTGSTTAAFFDIECTYYIQCRDAK